MFLMRLIFKWCNLFAVMRCPTATLAPTSNPTTDTTGNYELSRAQVDFNFHKIATDVVAGSVLGLQPLQATIPLILLCTYLIL